MMQKLAHFLGDASFPVTQAWYGSAVQTRTLASWMASSVIVVRGTGASCRLRIGNLLLGQCWAIVAVFCVCGVGGTMLYTPCWTLIAPAPGLPIVTSLNETQQTKRCWSNAALMVGQICRLWTNVKSTMDLVSAGMLGLVFLTHYIHYVYCLSLLVFVASIQSMGGGGLGAWFYRTIWNFRWFLL